MSHKIHFFITGDCLNVKSFKKIKRDFLRLIFQLIPRSSGPDGLQGGIVGLGHAPMFSI